MRDAPRLLVVGTGSLTDRFVSLVSGCEVETMPARSEPDSVDLGPFAAVALASERPLAGIELLLGEACWRSATPWTTGLLLAQHFRLGPTIVPGCTPCHECWRRRVRSQAPDRAVHDAIEHLGMTAPSTPWFHGSLPALEDQVAAMLAAEVMSLMSDRSPPRSGNLGRYWTGDAVYGYLQAHQFAAIGTCTRCVTEATRGAGPPAHGRLALDVGATPEPPGRP